MPNHVHGIIIINDSVGATHASPLRGKYTLLGDIVGSFKSAVTKHINRIRNTPHTPVWQRGYYDHIIRDEKSFHRIQAYIATNPARWQMDKENTISEGIDAFDKWPGKEGNKQSGYRRTDDRRDHFTYDERSKGA